MIILLITWSVIGGFILAIASAMTHRCNGAIGRAIGWEFVNPCFVYKHNKVNWFGATLVALFYSMLCPLGALGYWFYKLCTMGRK